MDQEKAESAKTEVLEYQPAKSRNKNNNLAFLTVVTNPSWLSIICTMLARSDFPFYQVPAFGFLVLVLIQGAFTLALAIPWLQHRIISEGVELLIVIVTINWFVVFLAASMLSVVH